MTTTNNKKNKMMGDLDSTRQHPAYAFLLDAMGARVKLAVEINKARISKSLSQEQLAKDARTTQKVVSRIESGDVNVGFDLLTRIANCLGLKFQLGETIFGGKVEMTTNNQVNANIEESDPKYILAFVGVQAAEPSYSFLWMGQDR